MRFKLLAATAAVAVLASGSAFAQSANLTIWSWNVAASALKSTLPGFNKQFPDIKITVEDLGNSQVFDKTLAACAAGGDGLPDIVSIENFEAEIFWSRFPDCFANLKELGYTADIQAKFPDFKRTELEVGDVAYAMPWDSGPVAVFYRRDLYEKAGVDPSTISTWDDFIAAGKKISAANPGVVMAQADFNGDSEWFRMIANEQGCGYYSTDGQNITINQPACVASLQKVKEMKDAGTLTSANWDEKIQANTAGKAASQLYGGWYEGTVRSTSPDLKGKWGVYRMPSLTADGPHAANLGGSSLAISATSANKEAAWKFVNYALGTDEGQITMLKEFGLVPSLLSAEKDPFVNEPQPYWGGQKVWADILATLPKIVPSRGTAFQSDAEAIFKATQTKFFAGGYPDAKAALDDAAKQIASATGLPIAQ
ncbi:extracellular solute-binding protein (plasmid) [Rhizobium leguminosarum]|jgi:lactose/L-arabinose transport system substrate-binding protein|uniref:ABC transporter substrate-binding protein n=3 Tax=Rhizobium TaxID=379 RepID=A0A1B8RKB5_RHILT|nr:MULTISPECIES: extracellular solute-binding protein [Rhizobium]MDH6662423.1 lactose/L-arabinose transport system substrate-binding protein [Rhizobium sophorae]AOO87928.1 ABC transporter substrate-binding protein [Rhizobium leguminosarum bv. trifolii]ASS60016.1 ABC transporter substrate-binding protein [Rhizobium leguminosarum bv. viciae]AVC45767.1 bacterial extracellular solute-binding family protein [Rhizobium leguminosarum bv. viciae]AXA44362.1 Bacterial extracellular solute-binding family